MNCGRAAAVTRVTIAAPPTPRSWHVAGSPREWEHWPPAQFVYDGETRLRCPTTSHHKCESCMPAVEWCGSSVTVQCSCFHILCTLTIFVLYLWGYVLRMYLDNSIAETAHRHIRYHVWQTGTYSVYRQFPNTRSIV